MDGDPMMVDLSERGTVVPLPGIDQQQAANGQVLVEPELVRPGTVDVIFDPKRPGTPAQLRRYGQRTKVAIVGFAETTKEFTPYNDTSYEIWSLNQHYRYMPRATRWFEIHRRKDYLADQVEGTDYLSWLQHCPIPLYVTEPPVDLPTGILFPIDYLREYAHVF